jgi:hypothetical protein
MIRITFLAAIILCCFSTSARAQHLTEIGYTQLLDEYGAALEDGSGVVVSMVEAKTGNDANGLPIFLPVTNLTMPTHAEFVGKVFIDGSGGSPTISTHSRGTGFYFFGNNLSIAPGVTDITVFEANDYINRILNSASIADPMPQNFKVQNHSWAGNLSFATDVKIVMNRFDYINDIHDITSVVGIFNQTSERIPDLMAHSYNSITVGRSNGNHASGLTTTYGPGRVKPEIVVPGQPTVSRSTAIVSSTAALMHEATMGTDASHNETIKAMLLAGATKDEFPTWSRTEEQPLDEDFGAGELNIYNTYKIWEGGQFDGQDVIASAPVVGTYGWDYNAAIGANQSRFYRIDIPNGMQWEDFSIVLAWNMQINDTNGGPNWNPVEILANMDLFLRDSNGDLVDQSISTVDNVEHLYFPSLASGTYTLEVRSDLNRDYSIAWRATEVGVAYVQGDMNDDGVFSNADISAFVLALIDPTSYAAMYPNVDPDLVGDYDGNNMLTNSDIPGFVAALLGN